MLTRICFQQPPEVGTACW